MSLSLVSNTFYLLSIGLLATWHKFSSQDDLKYIVKNREPILKFSADLFHLGSLYLNVLNVLRICQSSRGTSFRIPDRMHENHPFESGDMKVVERIQICVPEQLMVVLIFLPIIHCPYVLFSECSFYLLVPFFRHMLAIPTRRNTVITLSI